MYPAQAFYDGLYSAGDLPDAIELECEAGPFILPKSGSTFTDGTIVVDNWFNPFYGYAIWRVYHPVPPFLGCGSEIGQCLITDPAKQGYYSRDQFADSYTITGGQLGPIQVTRVSLCVWTGTDSCGNPATLLYTENEESGKLWFADVPNYIDPELCEIFDVRQGDKIGLQNTPVGDYGTEEFVVLTVS